MSNVIEIEQLKFSYKASDPLVLDIPHWQMPAGKSVFLHGPSGSGKSTLLNLISATLSLSQNTSNSGDIKVLGKDLKQMSNPQKDRFRASNLGVVFQSLNLIQYLTVKDNIKLAFGFSKNKQQNFDEQYLLDVLTKLGLPNYLIEQKASDLSVGQQQRIAIARAIFHQPQLLIVDEPTSALDADATQGFMELLLANVKELQASLLFVSHDMALAQDFDVSLPLQQLNRSMNNNEPHANESAGGC